MNKHVMQAEAAIDAATMAQPLGDHNPWLGLSRNGSFFESDEIAAIIQRSTYYANVGIPVHFSGAAGQGKTSLALVLARRLGRPVAMMAGHQWLDASDMIGKEVGNTQAKVVDKYVQSVQRSETRTRSDWRHSILATAMERGHTLIYDEFTRASAQANGILLSVLEEGALISTDQSNGRTYLNAHPDFRIILTSNSRDYAGVNDAPDALLDRMITFEIGPFSAQTQIGIVAERSGLDPATAARIVSMVNGVTRSADDARSGSIRAAILMARIVAMRPAGAPLSDEFLAQVAADVLRGRGLRLGVAEIMTKQGSSSRSVRESP